MRSIFRTAFLTAVPMEVFNFWVVGYPAGQHSISTLSQNAALALQWYVLHLPGIILLDHSPSLRPREWACSIVLLIFGFFDTAMLIALALWIVRLARSKAQTLSSPRSKAIPSDESRSTRLSA